MTLELVAATAYLTCGALMLFLGFVILRENSRERVNRATAAMLLFAGLGPILGAYSSLGERAGAAPGSLFRDAFAQLAFLWEFFFPATLLFALIFPVRHPIVRRWPRLAWVLFVPHLFHVLLAVAGADAARLLAGLEVEGAVPWGAGLFERLTGLSRVGLLLLLRIHVRFFSIVNLTMATTSVGLLILSGRRTTNPKLRSQVRVIRRGLGVSLGLYSGGELLPTAFGFTIDRSLSLPLITVSLLVGAASIVIAIVRLGFLDVRFIVRRGLVYGLSAGGVVALYLFVGKQIDRAAARFVGEQLPVFETTFLVLSVFLLQPVLAGIEHWVDRTYARDREDVRNALARLSEEVSLLLDPGRVCEIVAGTIRREMVLHTAAVATWEREDGPCRLTVARDGMERIADWRAGGVLFGALAGRRNPLSVSEVTEQPPEPAARRMLAAEMERIGARLAFPLVAAASRPSSSPRGAEGDLVGVLFLGEKMTETRITFEETALVSLVARQVGISLVNGALHRERLANRLLEEEVATARRIQQQLLPEEPPALPGWEVCASNSPSRHVGGDYHDFLPLPHGGLGIAIGDVSGKGVPAALLMSNLQAALRVRVLDGRPPHRIVKEVNKQICRNTGPESFISFFLGSLEPERGMLSFTNAGHNAPLLVRRAGEVEKLEKGGLLLGVFPEATYELGRVRLDPGDTLLLYTDGLTEASNARGELFSEERLVETLVRHRGCGARTLHDRVLEEIRRFQEGGPPDDDVTLVLLKRTGGEREPPGRAREPSAVALAAGEGQAA